MFGATSFYLLLRVSITMRGKPNHISVDYVFRKTKTYLYVSQRKYFYLVRRSVLDDEHISRVIAGQ